MWQARDPNTAHWAREDPLLLPPWSFQGVQWWSHGQAGAGSCPWQHREPYAPEPALCPVPRSPASRAAVPPVPGLEPLLWGLHVLPVPWGWRDVLLLSPLFLQRAHKRSAPGWIPSPAHLHLLSLCLGGGGSASACSRLTCANSALAKWPCQREEVPGCLRRDLALLLPGQLVFGPCGAKYLQSSRVVGEYCTRSVRSSATLTLLPLHTAAAHPEVCFLTLSSTKSLHGLFIFWCSFPSSLWRLG